MAEDFRRHSLKPHFFEWHCQVMDHVLNLLRDLEFTIRSEEELCTYLVGAFVKQFCSVLTMLTI
jgi:hypothetical protein